MSFVVFWLDEDKPRSAKFGDAEMTKALEFVKILRDDKMSHVCISSELQDSVGKPGVDVTGADYDWKKRRA